jgi:lysozyme family protein
MRYSSKWPQYAAWWDRMTIKAGRQAEFERDAKFAIAHKEQYLAIEQKTGVRWYHIAVLHRRESDADFGTYLGNGQSLARRTTIVPKGRGPFTGPDAFVNGAIDALKIDGLSSVIDWRLEKILYYGELFNGAGYDGHGLPSPYLWGGTNIQQPGKYIRDGVFDRNVWDPQPGCAPMLAVMAKLDPTITFTRESAS